MSDSVPYQKPTKKDIRQIFGKKCDVKTFEMRKCDDVKNFIHKLEKAYERTKATSTQFD